MIGCAGPLILNRQEKGRQLMVAAAMEKQKAHLMEHLQAPPPLAIARSLPQQEQELRPAQPP